MRVLYPATGETGSCRPPLSYRTTAALFPPYLVPMPTIPANGADPRLLNPRIVSGSPLVVGEWTPVYCQGLAAHASRHLGYADWLDSLYRHRAQGQPPDLLPSPQATGDVG